MDEKILTHILNGNMVFIARDKDDDTLWLFTEQPTLKKKCTRVVTKKNCMDFMFTHGQWFFDGWKDGFEEYKKNVSNDNFLQCCAEENFNEKFSKEDCFVEMFKHEKLSWLFDDTIKDDKKITFLDNDNTVILFNPMKE